MGEKELVLEVLNQIAKEKGFKTFKTIKTKKLFSIWINPDIEHAVLLGIQKGQENSVSIEWLKDLFNKTNKTFGWSSIHAAADWNRLQKILLSAAKKEA